MTSNARFIVGIDLGTTHTVVAFADTLGRTAQGGSAQDHMDDAPEAAAPAPGIQLFPIEQWITKGELEAQPLLPSARFHLRSQDSMAPGVAEAALQPADQVLLGEYALELGTKNPERLVVSAKSWLCHPSVDREAPILPWGSPDSVFKTSPVDASASYLEHVRISWNRAHPQHPLEEQEVLLTVPASFDESARALTLRAAELAGFSKLRLVEEPLAAFYNWLNQFRATEGGEDRSDQLAEIVSNHRLALVVDCGGGTTDLTLIQMEHRESGPRLTRIAVGEHLLLGGDNMDLALAKAVEPELAGSNGLSAAQFSELVHAARNAKEALLSENGPNAVPITMLGTGSKLIGKGRSTQVTREQTEETVLDGFFPTVEAEATPTTRAGAVMAFGLPYVSDPAITKHVAGFLQQNARLSRVALNQETSNEGRPPVPDAVLLNGGVFQARALQERLLSTLAGWRGDPPTLLEGSDPERAVARGAVAYGLARRGIGLRIGGGSPRSYFLVTEPVTNAEGAPSGQGCLHPAQRQRGRRGSLPQGPSLHAEAWRPGEVFSGQFRAGRSAHRNRRVGPARRSISNASSPRHRHRCRGGRSRIRNRNSSSLDRWSDGSRHVGAFFGR